MSKRNSGTASKLDRALEAVDRNLADAAATVAVERITARHYRHTHSLLSAACTIAKRSGASRNVIIEALADTAFDQGDERAHDEIISSLFRERR